MTDCHNTRERLVSIMHAVLFSLELYKLHLPFLALSTLIHTTNKNNVQQPINFTYATLELSNTYRVDVIQRREIQRYTKRNKKTELIPFQQFSSWLTIFAGRQLEAGKGVLYDFVQYDLPLV